MFGQKEYDEYVRLQKIADNIWQFQDEFYSEYEAEKAQEDANVAYEMYEYASGLKVLEDI